MKKLILFVCTLFLIGCEDQSVNSPSISAENQHILGLIGEDVVVNVEQSQVSLGGKTYEVEIADEHKERRQGLMFRESLAEDAGMLFVFDETKIYPFWMKNTLIPLYMIWISEDLEVVEVQRAVPCKQETCPQYVPKKMAKYVLEIAG